MKRLLTTATGAAIGFAGAAEAQEQTVDTRFGTRHGLY